MSDKPIGVGDLVMVVHIHCGKAMNGGKIGVVTSLMQSPVLACTACGESMSGDWPLARVPSIASDRNNPMRGWFPLSWLKKIDPLSSDETIEHRETEHAH